jgi:hypothetical protein
MRHAWSSGPRRGGPAGIPEHQGRGRLRARQRARLLGSALAAFTLLLGLAVVGQAGASTSAAAAKTALSETGWTASSNTTPPAGDAPANAIDGNINTRFSTDADEAVGQYFQVNLGSTQSFNQIEMDSGPSAADYARGYNVEVSTDGTTFTSVATGTATASPSPSPSPPRPLSTSAS